MDEVHAMDVGRLTSEHGAFERFVERFGTPEQLAAGYLEQLAIEPFQPCRWSNASFLRTQTVVAVLLLVITSGGVCLAVLREPPKLSPFTDVRFVGEHIDVTFDGQTFRWRELDEIRVEDIVKSAQEQFGNRWQKRISEDLVEVLWGMSHKPSRTVQLRLTDLTTNEDVVIENAPLTRENRRALYLKRLLVRDAAETEQDRSEPPKRSPFTEVRFQDDQVFVTWNRRQCEWLELDEISVEYIVALAKQQYRDRWQKRVSEDLVEVLWRMNHQPGRTVMLRLRDIESKLEFVVRDAPMSEGNRWAIWTMRRLAEHH